MSSSVLATLDLDDLTPRQLRRLLRGAAEKSMPRNKRAKEEVDEEDDEADKENDDLVSLHREKGDSKPPKVEQDDLPDSAKNDLEPPPEEDAQEMLADKKKDKK
jgi:hypothetical protein